MSLSSPTARRPRPLPLGLAAALAGLAGLAQAPASAAVRPVNAPAARPVVAGTRPAAATAATPPISALALTGTATRVTVRRIFRTGQVSWVNHVIDTRLVDVDGCQARRSATAWRRHVYRSTVYAICPGAPGVAEAAAKALVRSRPWYRVSVDPVAMVGFTVLAGVPSGNDRAVPAALAQLPTGASVFFEGDDVSLTWAGPGATQAQLDAAVAAFARELGIPATQVTVRPLAG
ncbi:MAG TPA: hypothetical protein VI248_09440 [Kineosporiaceae bacterium]